MSLAWQIVLRAADSRVLAPSIGERRVLARTVLRIGMPRGLLAFGAADTHLHVLVLGDRATAGRTAQAIGAALTWGKGREVGSSPAAVSEVRDQWHLESTFHYVLGQGMHHGVGTDPLLEATSLPDLLGLRVIAPGLISRVREILPRTSRERLLGHLGVAELGPAVDLPLLLESAAAVVCLPDLNGCGRDAIAARRAALHVAGPHFGRDLLGESERTERRLRSGTVDPTLLSAVKLQMGLRAAISSTLGDQPRKDGRRSAMERPSLGP